MVDTEGVPAVRNLPAAAPGYDGGVLIVRLDRCWATRQYRSGRGAGQCPEKVGTDDDLGLCEEHRTELRP